MSGWLDSLSRYIPAIPAGWNHSLPPAPVHSGHVRPAGITPPVHSGHSGRLESLHPHPRCILAIPAGWNQSPPPPSPPPVHSGHVISDGIIPPVHSGHSSHIRTAGIAPPVHSSRLESIPPSPPPPLPPPPAPGTFRPCQVGCNHLPVHSGRVRPAVITSLYIPAVSSRLKSPGCIPARTHPPPPPPPPSTFRPSPAGWNHSPYSSFQPSPVGWNYFLLFISLAVIYSKLRRGPAIWNLSLLFTPPTLGHHVQDYCYLQCG